jgi:phytoene dehydrogenase-like protein
MGSRLAADITKLFTMSAADLLDEWFESSELKALIATGGIIGTWAGPEEPGTA